MRQRRGSGSSQTGRRWLPAERIVATAFDFIVPGHGTVVKKADMQSFRASTQRLTQLITDAVRAGRSKSDIETIMRGQFGWQDFHVQMALDGLINEMR